MQGPAGATRIASVAQAFLSEMRTSGGSSGAPTRIKPKQTGHSHPPPQQADQPCGADPLCISSARIGTETKAVPTVYGVFASHLHWDGAKALGQFARYLAADGNTVGLLKLEMTAADLRLFYHKDLGESLSPLILDTSENRRYSEDPPGSNGDSSHGEAGWGKLWPLLERITPRLDYLLVAWGPAFDLPLREKVLSGVDQACVLVDTESDHLISSYQLIKSLAGEAVGLPLGIFVTGAPSRDEADRIFDRLNRTARQFAQADLTHFGFSLADQNVAQELLCRTDVGSASGVDREQCVSNLERYLQDIASIRTLGPSRMAPNNPDAKAEQCDEIVQEDVPPKPPTATSAASAETLLTIDLAADEGNPGGLIRQLANGLGADTRQGDSDLIKFLLNCDVQCVRAEMNGCDVLMALVRDQGEREMLSWVLNNYPAGSEALIVVSTLSLDLTFQHGLSRRFAQVKVVPAVEGLLNGVCTLILQNLSGFKCG